MTYKIISSNSHGNAVIYHDSILVDCGVSFTKLKNDYMNLKIVLLTHKHMDHFNTDTIVKLALHKPTLRWACGEFLAERLSELGVKNIDVLEVGKLYDYKEFQISPIILYHDVPNFGYRIFKNGHKIIHATDTNTLEGISAKGYDLYAIEHNHDIHQIEIDIREKQERGVFAYELGSRNSHLSFQQAEEFIRNNAQVNYEVIKLHMSERYRQLERIKYGNIRENQ